jgi:hypothetical protein
VGGDATCGEVPRATTGDERSERGWGRGEEGLERSAATGGTAETRGAGCPSVGEGERSRKENGGKGEPEKEDDICGGV